MASKYVTVHQSPNGPGDARPTAQQIISDENLDGKLSEKVIFVTGCSSGIGVETARALFATGAKLYLTARDVSKAKRALSDLATSDRVRFLELNLDSLDSVRACADAFISESTALNILIANAGIMACPEGRTKDGFELQLGTNHLAHFLLFNLLKPALLSAATPSFNSRVVFLSSVGHRMAEVNFDNMNLEGAYNEWVAYGQSKTAVVWTVNEIDRRYGSQGLHAFSVSPGGIMTDLQRHLPDQSMFAGLEKVFKSPEQGAATTIWAATSQALEGEGARYLEDCQISKAWTEGDGQWGNGYAPWAYDEMKEGRLWRKSLEMVGLKEE